MTSKLSHVGCGPIKSTARSLQGVVGMVVVFTGGMMVAGVTAWHPCYFLLCLSTIASIFGHHTLLWRWSFVFTIPWCPLIYLPAIEINFWVWSSAGPVGLKFTVRSANLLITLIIFNFFVPILREYCMFFVFRNSLQKRTFCFPFCQTSAICIYPSMPSGTGFFGRSGCFRWCVNFFISW